MGRAEQWLKQWIAALKDRRESARMSLPIIAYYWNGATPEAYRVTAVSQEGAYIVTADRWYIGTVLRLTFQYGGSNGSGLEAIPSMKDDPKMSQMVRAKLVRTGPDGVGVRLIYLNRRERRSFRNFLLAVVAAANAQGNS